MTRATWKVAGLLFFSGACALIYQTVWLRQFRLIFGASTYATGAVLAIFMGGLGLGSALLGKRADAKERPLAYYAQLELLIAAAAALSPLLLWVAAKVYFSSGGSPQLGIAGATLLRIVLSIVILGPATLLMGGTLPAAARAVETDEDSGRRAVALLYGVNTLGAVAGTLLSTFVMLERLGNRKTLLMAVGVNAIVAIAARAMARTMEDRQSSLSPKAREQGQAGLPVLHPGAIYIASAVVGFAFLLMELVWYRMLAPILGGTTYTFGLILAIALAGIGLGGAAYALFLRRGASAGAFAITCSLEALAIIVPYALGDRLAIFANVLRNLGVTGFAGHVIGWTMVTAIVVFPAAFIAGIQFPMLIALLGQGREHVGRQIGAAYAWNTAGAIAGSLAGGFGLLPLLSAPGTWRFVAMLLMALALVFALRSRQRVHAAITILAAAAAGTAFFAQGPTAVWRHSGIGAARAQQPQTANDHESWITRVRRRVLWERDGRESSVALIADADLSFMVNGKSDGSAVGDAGTQIMLGIVGAALHPRPQSALVVGLGTGSTAGWLGRIPSMQRVDVVELEPVVLDVARACDIVNANAMSNPKVHITIGDAREVLLATRRRYDLIASEPSNPYRAGVASLFTHDFYKAAADRLEPGGFFLQWVQMYEIGGETLQTIYATLTGVFPHVQTWRTTSGDLMLLASKEQVVLDAGTLRRRLSEEPYRSAILYSWGIDSFEGFLARLLANENFARAAAANAPATNTDDRTVIEFGFARSVGTHAAMPQRIMASSRDAGTDRPLALRGAVDWESVAAHRSESLTPPRSPRARALLGAKLARDGDKRAMELVTSLREQSPVDAFLIGGEMLFRLDRHDAATAAFVRAFTQYRVTPWAQEEIVEEAMRTAVALGETSPERAALLHTAMSEPFAAMQRDNFRRFALIALARRFDGCGAKTLAALQAVEPNPYWTSENLAMRPVCYERAGLADLAERARRDLHRFQDREPTPVVPPPSRPAPP
ncbi:MAG TPA: fused MFS/spermidine synthase [Thermoanaerobaculia bacterium]|nr:fused MFS/spermidine synthase [Thermoanaerobaculia bacterium]